MHESNGNKAAIIFLSTLLVVCLALACYVAQPFFQALFLALIMAVAFNPFYKRALRFAKTPNRAAILTVLLIVVVIAIPLTALLIMAGTQAVGAAQFVSQRSAQEGGLDALLIKVAAGPLAFAGKFIDLSHVDLKTQLIATLNRISGAVIQSGASILGNIVGFIGQVVLALFTAFFFLRDGERAVREGVAKLPITQVQADKLLNGITDAIVANLYAIVAVGGVQGLLTGVALGIVGIKSAILLGLLASICSLIPLIGTALVWGPAAGYLLFTGHPVAGIFVIAWGVLVVGMSDNIVRPLVVGGRVEAHPLLLLLSLLGGAQAFGLMGIFIGPVLLSLIMALLRTLREVSTAGNATDHVHTTEV